MKIHKQFSGRRGLGLARTGLALVCALVALLSFAAAASAEQPGGDPPVAAGQPGQAAAAARFKTLEEAAAAGKLDPALVRDLRERGRAEGIVTFEYKEIQGPLRRRHLRAKGARSESPTRSRPPSPRRKCAPSAI